MSAYYFKPSFTPLRPAKSQCVFLSRCLGLIIAMLPICYAQSPTTTSAEYYPNAVNQLWKSLIVFNALITVFFDVDGALRINHRGLSHIVRHVTQTVRP